MSQFPVTDKAEALRLVSQAGHNLTILSPELLADIDVVRAAVINEPSSIKFAAPSMKDDIEIAYLVISEEPLLFAELSPRLKVDIGICLEAVQKDPVAFSLLPLEKRQDPDVFNQMIKHYQQNRIGRDNVTISDLKDTVNRIVDKLDGRSPLEANEETLHDISRTENPYKAIGSLMAIESLADSKKSGTNRQIQKQYGQEDSMKPPSLSL